MTKNYRKLITGITGAAMASAFIYENIRNEDSLFYSPQTQGDARKQITDPQKNLTTQPYLEYDKESLSYEIMGK